MAFWCVCFEGEPNPGACRRRFAEHSFSARLSARCAFGARRPQFCPEGRGIPCRPRRHPCCLRSARRGRVPLALRARRSSPHLFVGMRRVDHRVRSRGSGCPVHKKQLLPASAAMRAPPAGRSRAPCRRGTATAPSWFSRCVAQPPWTPGLA